jgi:hypothetical protein
LVAGQLIVPGPERDGLTLELSEEGLARSRRAARRRPGLVAALRLDLVAIAILNWKAGRPMMAAGYRDIPLPAAALAFAPGTRLELRFRPEETRRPTRSGLMFGTYQFRFAPGQTDWSTVLSAEADDPRAFLVRLHG